MANQFLDTLCAALENDQPTDAILKDASGSGTPDLEAQKKAMDDKTGNTDAPGDPNANPVADRDPEQNPTKTDLPAQKDSSLENAENVPAPGDKNGNPAPASESFFSGDPAVKKYMEMDSKALLDEFMKARLAEPNFVSNWSRNDCELQMKEVINDEDLDPSECEIVKFGDGFAVKYIYKDGGCALEYATRNPRNGRPVYHCDYTRTMAKYLAKRDKKASKSAPASEMEGFHEDTTTGLKDEVGLHKSHNLIETAQAKAAKDPSGNTGDPADNKQTPVSPSGDSKEATLDKAVNDSYDKSGNTGDPSSVNGTPVSKSGDSKPLGKNEFEKAADDKSGNPEAPGVNGDPAPSFESFITACEQLVIGGQPGSVKIPESMSLESYAMELGMGEIAARAMEVTLTAAEKRALKDSDFGLPNERKWPLNDESHVRSAIQHFHWCPKEQQRELAKNILKAMRKFGMKNVEVSEGNPFAAYYPEAKLVPRKKPEKKAQ